ncbi:MAG TPA: hypothetical protein GXX37_09450 [Clostridiaceae bacterium]|nr:hypothetical protein [Clostridiaceae bacterium]
MRHWNILNNDGSIHCLGNGKLTVYEQCPDIIQVFGSPYSSPSFMKMNLINANDDNLEVKSERKKALLYGNIVYF